MNVEENNVEILKIGTTCTCVCKYSTKYYHQLELIKKNKQNVVNILISYKTHKNLKNCRTFDLFKSSSAVNRGGSDVISNEISLKKFLICP